MLTPENHALWHAGMSMHRFFLDADDDRFFVEGHGAKVRDRAGRWYLDARSSLWNVTLGFDHPGLLRALHGQLDVLPSMQTIRYDRASAVAAEYANRLCAQLPENLTHVRFGNTGSQVTSAAVLLSKYIRKIQGEPERTGVVALESSWHGTGGLATALTGEPDMHDLQAPLVPGVHHIPPPHCPTCPDGASPDACAEHSAAHLSHLLDRVGAERITALIVEPMMGTRVVEGAPGYLRRLEQICRDNGVHFIVDEVTTGFGRCGDLTLSGSLGVRADMLLLGKGISGGYVPSAALAVDEDIYRAVFDVDPARIFPHGSTTDGHPLAMAAGLAVLDALAEEDLLAQVGSRGEHLREALGDLATRQPVITDVRGRGLLIGVELTGPDGTPMGPAFLEAVRRACEQRGVLLNYTGNCITLVPPFVITRRECDQIVETIDGVLLELVSQLESWGDDSAGAWAWDRQAGAAAASHA
ncbi:aspartate aminotransferase family protein [Streptomyces sp. G44]|uniref:aminotransferase family protein n=1 Tax=Streptomyces sp. G44 TaxID=2807632 RepID=UPI001961E49A|nr:aminotransferase class III-fold pyridoxal phosphate-dependent enzyme [Streptomyces sp. G44]MBM7168893.1 aspartate aminotransferase family protein [Streptomyces sp. G44]